MIAQYIVPSLKICCLNHNVIFCQLWYVYLIRMCKGTSSKHVGDTMINFSPTHTMLICGANAEDNKFDMMRY